MTFTSPIALVLLLVIPLILYVGWPRNRFRRARDVSSLLLRITIALLLIFSLAGLQVVQNADRLAVVFLLDVSDSMGTAAQEEALAYMQDAMNNMQPDDLAGVVAFGADAQVARSISTARELGPIRATPGTGNTDLAGAIRLGLALFPGDTARRMVIFTDGQETVGDAESAARLASAAGVEISYVPFSRPPEPEIQVRNVDVPATVDEGQEFDMTVTISSEETTDAVITVLASGQIITRQQEQLREGENSYTLNLVGGATGFRDFQVQVDPLGADGFYQNNTLGAFTRVEGASRALLVGDSSGDELRHIVPALQESGIEVDVIEPGGLPGTVSGLAAYDSVVLVNVPATRLTDRRMAVIDTYVSDLGGGLVVIGGPESYGPGGYFQTPLEDALPVEMQIRDQQRLPQLTIAYVIDRSGSMGATGDSGISNIDLAKGAIIRSIDFLQPNDRAGVASFDTSAYWIAEIQEILDKRELQRLVGTLRSSGGTSIKAGMDLVAASIVDEPSDLKHIILLTDGGAEPRGLVEQSRELFEEHNVTTSVISIGQFEADFLQRMADVANGNYHNVTDPETIPEIFAQETVLATRTYIQEDAFFPVLTARHPIMENIAGLPELQGYVATAERSAAQVILRGPEPYSDPVLVAWQYGLGRSVAFTSDATGRWAQNWVGWDDFTTFWSQAVRWTITEGASSNLESQIVMENEQARIIVDARDDAGDFLNGLDLQASVVDPEQGARRVTLRQVAPGRYEAIFTPQEEGAYFIRVAGEDAAETGLELNQTTGWVMSYSPEYEIRAVNDELLTTLAELTGGGDYTETPDAVFEHNLSSQNASVPLWPWMLFLAMILLPFDIGVRRLLLTTSDITRLRKWLWISVLGRGQKHDEATATRLSSLRAARNRARDEAQAQANPASSVSALRERRAARQEAQPEREAQVPTPSQPEPAKPRYTRAPEQPQSPKKETEGDTNIGSRLLKRRREREE